MDLKKNLFFIIVSVVVLGALGAYLVLVPNINAQTESIMDECRSRNQEMRDIALKAKLPDAIKTNAHVRSAKEYDKQLGTRFKELNNLLNTKLNVDVQFNDAPQTAAAFNPWLDKLRDSIKTQANNAGLTFSPNLDADKIMFANEMADDASKIPQKRREYRLRHMAIIQELVAILARERVSIPSSTIEAGVMDKPKVAEVGATELSKLLIHHDPAPASDPWVVDAHRRGQSDMRSKAGPAAAAAKAVELPYTRTRVELHFTAPLQVVPKILRAIETSQRFNAVLTKLETQRAQSSSAQSNLTSATDKALEKAGPNPAVNSYFLEGPVKVALTLELYEYDKSKEENFKKVAEGK